MFQYREDDENEASHAKDSKESSTSESQERTNLLRLKRQKGGSKVKKRRSGRLKGSSQEISLIGGSTVKQRRGKSITPSHLSSTKPTPISKFQLEKHKRYPIRNAKVDRKDRLAIRRSEQSFLGRSTQNAASGDIAQHNHAQSTNNAEYESADAEEEEDNEHILPPIHISKFQLKKQRRYPIKNAKVDRRDRLASRRSNQSSLLPEANAENDVNRSTSIKHQLLKRPSLNEEQNNLIEVIQMQSAASGDIGDSNNINARPKRSLVGHDTDTNANGTKKRPKKGGVATAKKLVVQIDAAKKIQMYWKEARRRSVEEKLDKEASLSAKSRDVEYAKDIYEKEETSRTLTKRKKWTAQEDDALCSAVKKNNGGIPLAKCSRFLDWKMIAKEVPSRTFEQCQQRWNKVLKYRDGGEAKGQSKWSSEEDSIIVRLHRERGNRWKVISNALNGKTPNEVRNHFIRHLQGSKRINEQKQSRLQKQSLATNRSQTTNTTNAKGSNAITQGIFHKVPLRRGKWTNDEETYANAVIEAFEQGIIQNCDNGIFLRLYLSQKLHCQPMRISKKYAGKSIGKQDYLSKMENHTDQHIAYTNENLAKLEFQFHMSIIQEGFHCDFANNRHTLEMARKHHQHQHARGRSKRVDDYNLIEGLPMQSAASGDISDSKNINTRSKQSLVGHKNTNANGGAKKRPKKGGVATAKKLVAQIDAANKIQMYWKGIKKRSVGDKEASLSAKPRDVEYIQDDESESSHAKDSKESSTRESQRTNLRLKPRKGGSTVKKRRSERLKGSSEEIFYVESDIEDISNVDSDIGDKSDIEDISNVESDIGDKSDIEDISNVESDIEDKSDIEDISEKEEMLRKFRKIRKITKWTPQEDKALFAAVKKNNGKKWKTIAKEVPSRTVAQCYQRWRTSDVTEKVQIDASKKIQMYWKRAKNRSVGDKSDKEASPSAKSRDMESNILDIYEKEETSRILTKRKNWTAQEDDALCSAVKKNNEEDWKMIAKEVPSRTFEQCRNRWNNVLKYRDGGEAKGQSKWSSEEDSIIVRLHRERGNRWKDISDALNGKTPNEVRNHFNRHLQGSNRTNEHKQPRPQEQSRLPKQSLPQGFTRMIDLPKGFTRKIDLPKGLRKALVELCTMDCREYKNCEFIFSILKVFVFPRAPVELRSEKIWKLRTMRYLNYFSALILLIRYQDHDELPEELRCDGIPPWWYVVRFFNHFKLPQESRESNDTSLYDNSLGARIRREFKNLHGGFIIWIDIYGCYEYGSVKYDSRFIFKDDYLDCSLDESSKELYADLQVFIDNYNKQYNVGAYDETWFNKDTKKCKDEKRHDELMEIGSSGLHHFEIALMETAFQAKPLTQDEQYKQFAALKIDSIKVYEKLEMTEKEIKEKDSIIDAQNIEIEILKQQLANEILKQQLANEILKQQLAKKNEKNSSVDTRMKEELSMSKRVQEILSEDLQCPICFNPMKDPCIVPECCHRFCFTCITDAIAKSGKECPICRARITSKRDLRRDELFGQIAEVVCRHDGKEDDDSEKS